MAIITEAYETQKVIKILSLVEALRYKPEGRGLDSWWCHWKYLLT